MAELRLLALANLAQLLLAIFAGQQLQESQEASQLGKPPPRNLQHHPVLSGLTESNKITKKRSLGSYEMLVAVWILKVLT